MAKNVKMSYTQADAIIRKTVDIMVERNGYAYTAGYLSSALTRIMSNVNLNDMQKDLLVDLQVYADVNKK
jgi:hypothetical protein